MSTLPELSTRPPNPFTSPFYQDEFVTLLCGDASVILPQFPLKSVDAVVTDPPYGETSLKWDQRCAGWPTLVLNLLKSHGSLWCFGSMRMFLESVAAFKDYKFAQDLVWEKQNGSGFHADRFKRVHENALQFYPAHVPWASVFKRPVKTMDAQRKVVRTKRRPTHMGQIDKAPFVSQDGGPRLMRSVLQVKNCHGFAVHPTQKPEGIVEPLLRYSCPVGGTVLDPFAGSGTTLLVARRLGMRAVGIEMEERFCEAAVKRLRS